MIWTEYSDSFGEFYSRYLENEEKYGSNHGFLARPDIPPENAYTVSCVPWLEFEHFAVHSYENKPYFFTSAEAGKYHEENGKLIMPISVTCHHAATDGYHLKKFFEESLPFSRRLYSDCWVRIEPRACLGGGYPHRRY